MCGIVGYAGDQNVVDILLQGLRRLEYRGYDSAGAAVIDAENNIQVCKAVGRIDNLAKAVGGRFPEAKVGIGHTRWATHGAATEGNAHPHFGGDDQLALCHNGVIENFFELRRTLEAEGYAFVSDTDSEVIAHLLDAELEAARKSSRDLERNRPQSFPREALRRWSTC